jgi:HEAT repeat protein
MTSSSVPCSRHWRNTVLRSVGVVLMLLATSSAWAQSRETAHLLERFSSEPVFWKQFDAAKALAAASGDRAVLPLIEWLLIDEDRHVRANAAYVYARLGDERGFDVLAAVLSDRSERPLGQGIPGSTGNLDAPGWWMRAQIRSDRYYAVHVLGELRDASALDVLLPLLSDGEVNYKVAWALGEIGDRRAVPALIAALTDHGALMRASAIKALQALGAREALPYLRRLLPDQALPSAGDRVPVGATARVAIAALEGTP